MWATVLPGLTVLKAVLQRCVDQIDRALKTMRKMMPHIDVEKKLGETDQHSSIWGSFNTLL